MRLHELVQPGRVLGDLDTLHRLTADEHGAQRLAWSERWRTAREWLRAQLVEIGAESWTDAAGNLWATRPGAPRPLVGVGSHLDSVPDGGRYDGALGVLAALELLRAARDLESAVHGIALIDFADEEGARFGHSLFGSTAMTGQLDAAALSALVDGDGIPLVDALAPHQVLLESANTAATGLADVLAFVELHVEQGPELDNADISVAPVTGATGIRRLRVTVTGQATHAGGTAMSDRRDPVLAASAAIVAIAAEATALDGLATFGEWCVEPSIATAVPGRATFSLDLRHADSAKLAELTNEAQALLARSARDRRCELSVSEVWHMDAVRFDASLVASAAASAAWAGGSDNGLVSARGHDSVVLAKQLPVAMLFCPSENGLSHNAAEHTRPEDIERGVRALAHLVGQIAAGDLTPETPSRPTRKEVA